MDYAKLVKKLMARGGFSYHGLSRALGKADSYAASYCNALNKRGGVPKIDTLAAIADLCGCEIVLIDKDTKDVISRLE